MATGNPEPVETLPLDLEGLFQLQKIPGAKAPGIQLPTHCLVSGRKVQVPHIGNSFQVSQQFQLRLLYLVVDLE